MMAGCAFALGAADPKATECQFMGVIDQQLLHVHSKGQVVAFKKHMFVPGRWYHIALTHKV